MWEGTSPRMDEIESCLERRPRTMPGAIPGAPESALFRHSEPQAGIRSLLSFQLPNRNPFSFVIPTLKPESVLFRHSGPRAGIHFLI